MKKQIINICAYILSPVKALIINMLMGVFVFWPLFCGLIILIVAEPRIHEIIEQVIMVVMIVPVIWMAQIYWFKCETAKNISNIFAGKVDI